MSPVAAVRATLDEVGRELARGYLRRHAADRVARFPQLAVFAFDEIGTDVMVDGRYDAALLDFVVERLGNRLAAGTLLDIGANIGNHAAAFARVARRVITFEPHPRTRQLLALNMAPFANVEVRGYGASDRDAMLWAETPATNHGATAIIEGATAGWPLDVRRLDDVADLSDEPVVAIKLDVEGHEASALRGAERLIRRHRPLVMLEVNAEQVRDGSSDSVDLLRSWGYGHLCALTPYLPWRTPERIPQPFRRGFRFMESLWWGPPAWRVAMTPLTVLERRSYQMLLLSAVPL